MHYWDKGQLPYCVAALHGIGGINDGQDFFAHAPFLQIFT